MSDLTDFIAQVTTNVTYLDEAGCRVSSLLEMLLSVLLLDFEGKPRTQDALQV